MNSDYIRLLNNTACDSPESLRKNLEELRNKYLFRNKKLLDETNISIPLEKFSKEDFNDGRITINYAGISWECVVKNNGKQRLVVILNGARDPKDGLTFKRFTWGSFMNANMLNIDDPMCALFEKLGLGWYIGTQNVDYTEYIVNIVEALVKVLGFNEVIFYGSSGGGSAAIRCAARMAGSTAIAINPQILLSEHSNAEKFNTITGLDLNNDKLERNNHAELIKANNGASKFLIAYNIQSTIDDIHYSTLMNTFHISEFKYGPTQIADNIIIWIYDAKALWSLHGAQEWPPVFLTFEHLCDLWKDNKKPLSDNLLLINEFWHDRFNELYLNEVRRRRLIFFPNIIDIGLLQAEKVFAEKELIIEESEKKYHHITLDVVLKPNRFYLLRFKSWQVLSDDNKSTELWFLAKDIKLNKVLKRQLFKEEGTICFLTSLDVKKIELRFYPGKPGYTENKSVEIQDIEIFEICKGEICQ